jgi:hypothetical protein
MPDRVTDVPGMLRHLCVGKDILPLGDPSTGINGRRKTGGHRAGPGGCLPLGRSDPSPFGVAGIRRRCDVMSSCGISS